jgi:hypothetical protein
MDDELAPDGAPVDELLPEGIPPVVLAAIRDRMHSRRLTAVEEPGHLEERLGAADDAVYVIDDGVERCMIGRPVGLTPDGCVYVLVAGISIFGYEQLRDGDVPLSGAFSESRDISLSAVFEVDGAVENIALVRRFRRAADVPVRYLPPSPFIEFSEEDAPTDSEDDGNSDDGDSDESGHSRVEGGSPTGERAGPGLLRRAFGKATGAARRAGVGRPGSGFPPY